MAETQADQTNNGGQTTDQQTTTQQMQQIAPQITQAAQGAKLLSETDMSGDNMLSRLLGGMA